MTSCGVQLRSPCNAHHPHTRRNSSLAPERRPLQRPRHGRGQGSLRLNGFRHGLCGRTFFLLPDEDEAEFREHEALWLAVWSPRDFHEHQAAEAAIRDMWREIRADRLEAQVLGDLFAAGELPDPAEADAAKTAAFKALNSLLRYRGRIEREHRQAMQALDDLRQRRLARTPALRPSEPEKTMPAAAPTEPSSAGAPRVATVPSASAPPTDAAAPPSTNAKPGEPEPARALNRHQRRALAAMSRRAA